MDPQNPQLGGPDHPDMLMENVLEGLGRQKTQKPELVNKKDLLVSPCLLSYSSINSDYNQKLFHAINYHTNNVSRMHEDRGGGKIGHHQKSPQI